MFNPQPKKTRVRNKRLYNSYKKEYCEYCGSHSWLERHHIIKRSQMGGDEHENLIILCKACHMKAHNGEISVEGLRRAKDENRDYNIYLR